MRAGQDNYIDQAEAFLGQSQTICGKICREGPDPNHIMRPFVKVKFVKATASFENFSLM